MRGFGPDGRFLVERDDPATPPASAVRPGTSQTMAVAALESGPGATKLLAPVETAWETNLCWWRHRVARVDPWDGIDRVRG